MPELGMGSHLTSSKTTPPLVGVKKIAAATKPDHDANKRRFAKTNRKRAV